MTDNTDVTETEERDPAYYYLDNPLVVHGGDKGDKTFDKLRIDPRGVLKGKDLLQAISTFQRKFATDSHNALNMYASPEFLAVVIAKLNGVTVEDIWGLPYEELPLLFLASAPFQYSGPAKKQSAAE
jgi:hypothetical protein